MPDNANFRFQMGQSCGTCRHRLYRSDVVGYTCELGNGDKLMRLKSADLMYMVVCDNWQEALHEHMAWRRKYIEDRIGTEDGDE